MVFRMGIQRFGDEEVINKSIMSIEKKKKSFRFLFSLMLTSSSEPLSIPDKWLHP